MDKETNYTVIVGHSNTLNDGKKLFDLLQRENDKIKKIYLITRQMITFLGYGEMIQAGIIS